MKVTVSVLGRFWAFNLARQLQNHGHLQRLITTYPAFEAEKYGIARARVTSHVPVEVVARGWQKTPASLRHRYNPQYFLSEWADRLAARKIPPNTEIVVAWSGSALHSLRRAKQQGATTVLERGSSHMRVQTRILTEEYQRLGLHPQVAHPAVYAKELLEYEEADYIAVPSQFVKQTFLEQGIPERKLLHLPFGVDLDEFQPIPKEDGTFRVIHAGGIMLRKGVHYLLQAFAELNLPNAELWLIGTISDEMRPFLKKYDNGKMFCRGPYPQRELHRYYSQGSVFCLASIEEGLAMVIPQAMACGLPVLCTTNTGGADIVRDGVDGFIIPIRDVKAIQEKLLWLYENPAAAYAMGKAAREHVIEHYTWHRYGMRAIHAYSQICRNK